MSEINLPATWELVDTTCTGDNNTPANITLGAGQTVTCTFTNTKLTANLRLQKEVVGGGSGKKSDWLLSADAAAPFDGKDIDKVPGDNVDYAQVYAGVTYKLTESAGPANYTPGDVWVCVTDEIDRAVQVVNPGDEVTLETGEYKTCTITNSRDLAKLKLRQAGQRRQGAGRPVHPDGQGRCQREAGQEHHHSWRLGHLRRHLRPDRVHPR